MIIWPNWEAVKNSLSTDTEVDPKVYHTYVFSSRAYLYAKKHAKFLIIVTKNNFGASVLKAMEEKYRSIIGLKYKDYSFFYLGESEFQKSDFKKCLSKSSVNTEQKKIEQINKSALVPVFNQSSKTVASIKNHLSLSDQIEEHRLKFDKNLASHFTLKNFCVGPSNKEAFVAIEKCISDFMRLNVNTFINPLFIWSKPGLGKTHLLYATYQKLLETQPNKKIFFIDADGFTDLYLSQIRNNKPIKQKEFLKFKKILFDYDACIIDDVQLLSGRKKTNEFLFQILSHFINKNKLFIFSSDIPPNKFQGFEKRLISRLTYGLNITINPPVLKTSIEIMKRILTKKKFIDKVSLEVISYVSEHYSNDIRNLEGIINRLIFLSMIYSDDYKDQISVALVKTWLADNPPNQANTVNCTVENIKKKVSAKFGLPVQVLESSHREKNISLARKISIYLCHDYAGIPLKQLGGFFGQRAHTSMLYAHKNIATLIHKTKEIKNIVNDLKKDLDNS